MKEIYLVDASTVDIAETQINKLLKEMDQKGYVAEILNLTPTTTQEKLRWRFVILFTQLPTPSGGPPIED